MSFSAEEIEAIRQKVASGMTQDQIRVDMGIPNRSQLTRLLKRENIRKHADVTPEEAAELVESLKTDEDGNATREGWGEGRVYDCFASMGVRIPRRLVRHAMHSSDAEGVLRRKRKAVVRRVYHAPHANYVWHTDANLKLVRWGFYIFGSIDGYSRYLLHLVVIDNNFAAPGALLYGRDVLENSVVPDLLRVDAGGENNLAVKLQLELGGSVSVGKSVHNIPIERFWRTCRSHVTERYRKLFLEWEAAGELDPDSPYDTDALRTVYMPVIQQECDVYRHSHNYGHRRGHGKPVVLYRQGVPPEESGIVDEQCRVGTRLPFTPDVVDTSMRMVESYNPQSLQEKYLILREVNKWMMEELLRL